MPLLLTTAYFPPVSYFAAIASEMGGLKSYKGEDRRNAPSSPLIPSVVYIEACENFQKQSYRNRCHFYAADGVQSLSVPIVHDGGNKIPIGKVLIDYSKPWLLQHRRAIISAYRTSAYFEYYQDDLFAILDSMPETLLELNTRLLQFFIDRIGLAVDLRMTQDYFPDACIPQPDGTLTGCTDLRNVIHPKHPDNLLAEKGLEKPYFQVFCSKYGFKSNLSIMDLLFNEGPDSIIYLYPDL
ncbi:MAG: WbqC family protein [Candidatus Cryptobacteroides sp.]